MGGMGGQRWANKLGGNQRYHCINCVGPGAVLRVVGSYVGVREMNMAWEKMTGVLDWHAGLLLEYVPKLMLLLKQLLNYITSLLS